MVGLMTLLEKVSRPIRLKSSGQTFYDTFFVPQKTCVRSVVRSDSRESRQLHELLGRRWLGATDRRAMWQRLFQFEVDLAEPRWESN